MWFNLLVDNLNRNLNSKSKPTFEVAAQAMSEILILILEEMSEKKSEKIINDNKKPNEKDNKNASQKVD
jgi:hypothetical protein